MIKASHRLCAVWFAAVVLLSVLVGCGQKGSLYFPDDRDDSAQRESTAQ